MNDAQNNSTGFLPKTRYDIQIADRGFIDLNPTQLGEEECEPHHRFGPYVRDCYLFHYIIAGQGTYECRRGSYQVTAGQCFMIHPGEITVYTADEAEPWHYIWVGMTGRLTKQLGSLPDVMEISDRSLFSSMLECQSMTANRELFLMGKCCQLISALCSGRDMSESKDGQSEYVKYAANRINQNYMKKLSVERLADDLHINRRYLSRLFEREYGMTVKEYITDVKMRHAEAFLRAGSSVSDTAALCGYGDVFNFSRMYKKYYGFPPSGTVRAAR